jgi:hypothetical protein
MSDRDAPPIPGARSDSRLGERSSSRMGAERSRTPSLFGGAGIPISGTTTAEATAVRRLVDRLVSTLFLCSLFTLFFYHCFHPHLFFSSCAG